MGEGTRKINKWLYVIIVSMAAASVLNILLFFVVIFAFAGADGGTWVAWYFGGENGSYFVIATILIALALIPFTRKLNIVLK